VSHPAAEAPPTSLAALLRHRALHAAGPESSRVWLFHSHVYFDHREPESVREARAFRDRIAEAFSGTAHVEVASFHAAPVGPHTRGSFEVLFTREVFADYVPWLMFTRPAHVDVLVHPLTRSQVLDHFARALWLGTPLELDRQMLEAVDARLVAAGRSEESIIEGTKRH
jgi:aromatic ring-cleaving dioxygenase